MPTFVFVRLDDIERVLFESFYVFPDKQVFGLVGGVCDLRYAQVAYFFEDFCFVFLVPGICDFAGRFFGRKDKIHRDEVLQGINLDLDMLIGVYFLKFADVYFCIFFKDCFLVSVIGFVVECKVCDQMLLAVLELVSGYFQDVVDEVFFVFVYPVYVVYGMVYGVQGFAIYTGF